MRKTCSEVKIGIDTGGTFTDIVMSIDDKIFTNKILSNPQAPAITVLQGLHQILEKNGVASILKLFMDLLLPPTHYLNVVVLRSS